MPKLYDVVKAMGSYTGTDGQEKTRWMNCGMIIKNKHGNVSLKLDAMPLGVPSDGDGGIWFALMTPTPRQQAQPSAPQQPAVQPAQPAPPAPPNSGQGEWGGPEEDIPF